MVNIKILIMKLEINLNDEPAFLNEIKKFIMDNVKSIARNEFEKQIKGVFAEKLDAALPNNLSLVSVVDKMLKDEIKLHIQTSLGGYQSKEELRRIIREEIAKQVKELLDKREF